MFGGQNGLRTALAAPWGRSLGHLLHSAQDRRAPGTGQAQGPRHPGKILKLHRSGKRGQRLLSPHGITGVLCPSENLPPDTENSQKAPERDDRHTQGSPLEPALRMCHLFLKSDTTCSPVPGRSLVPPLWLACHPVLSMLGSEELSQSSHPSSRRASGEAGRYYLISGSITNMHYSGQ